MRLSTNTIYNMSMMSILQQQGRLAHVRGQLASSEKILTPADAPRDAAQALVLSQSLAVNEQYAASRDTARRNLSTEVVELKSVTNALQAATPLLVQAANGSLSDADLEAVATELQGVYNQLLNSANARNGNGRYIFSGFDVNKPAFIGSPGSLSYGGDTGHRQLQVSGSRLMPVSHTGVEVFAAVTDSASYVATAGGKAPGPGDNTGTAVFTDVHIDNAALAASGTDYKVIFDVSGPTTTYAVEDLTSGTTVSTGNPYQPGAPMMMGGVSITFEGAPADGDSFVVARDRAADNNILNTIAGVVEQLKQGTATAHDQAALQNTINSGLRKLGNALDNVVTIRAEVGSRLNELDSLDTIGANRKLNYKTTLSGLQDLDYAKAASEYALTMVALKMSQKTFLDIQNLSMFKLA